MTQIESTVERSSRKYLVAAGLMLLALGPLFQVRGALSFVLWFLCILPAGALPPLLFTLGSMLPRAGKDRGTQ